MNVMERKSLKAAEIIWAWVKLTGKRWPSDLNFREALDELTARYGWSEVKGSLASYSRKAFLLSELTG